MPTLNTEREFFKIILPSSKPDDEAWVEVWSRVLTTDIVAVAGSKDKKSAGIEMITGVIKDWNFTDKAGNKLPVTADNVAFLDIKDFAKIIEETKAFKDLEALSLVKKNL